MDLTIVTLVEMFKVIYKFQEGTLSKEILQS